jgi:endoglycosylceramidase
MHSPHPHDTLPHSIPAHRPERARLEVDLARGEFTDALGRRVMLRGVNVGGRSKLPPYLPFELDDVDSDDEVRARAHRIFETVASWGCNVARVPFTWAAIEPRRGTYDARQIRRLGYLVDAAWSHGVRCFLDCHQDLFAEALGGSGAPRWALPQRARGRQRTDSPSWFMHYSLDSDVILAFDRFWENEDDLQNDFVRMWLHVVAELGDRPGLCGVEIINEPGFGSADLSWWRHNRLARLYQRLIDAIHATHPHLIVFYGMPGLEFMGLGPDEITLKGDPICYAPHLYDPGLLAAWRAGTTYPPEPMIAALGQFQLERGTPTLLGEFGAQVGAIDGPKWLARVLAAMDEHRVNGTVWECSHSDVLWNHEDLNLLFPDGTARPLVDALARPYIRDLSGEEAHLSWDRRARTAHATWIAGDQVTAIAIPRHCTPDGLESLEVDGAQTTYDPELAELRVLGEPGDEVTVSLVLA